MAEVLAQIPLYPSSYEASSIGRIRRSKPGKKTYVGKILKSYISTTTGYHTLNLTLDGVKTPFSVHVLVAMAFLGDKSILGYEVNHKNLIRTDNRLENLEWVTRSENIKHGFRIRSMLGIVNRKTRKRAV